MSNVDPDQSPIEAAAGTAEQDVIDAFELLSDETRVAILVTLWKIQGAPTANSGAPATFSEIYDSINYDHPGNFSYHLKKLTGQFVRNTERGYELRRPGRKIVEEIIAGMGSASPMLDTTQIDMACVLCGAPTAVTYEDEWLYQVCTECEGFSQNLDRFPSGMLNELALDPAGLDPERTPEDLFAAAWSRTLGTLYQQIQGVCPTCSGPVEATLEVCEQHESAGICEACGRLSETAVYYCCTSCKNDHRTLLKMVAMFHPAMVAFYDRHGVEVGWGLGDFTNVKRMLEHSMEHEVELLSGESDRIQVTAREAGDEITLTFDENINAVAVER